MKFNLFLSLVLLLGCTSCIEEINFQQPPDAPSQIVVYGKISNNPSPHDLRILETIPYGDDRREREVEGATVFIEDDLGNREQYLETGGGNYQLLQATVKGTPGRTYSLDILLPGGKRLRSLPETMPPVLPIDSQYWQLDSIRFFHTFINAKIPPAPAEGGVWLRWETDHHVHVSHTPRKPQRSNPCPDRELVVGRPSWTRDRQLEVDAALREDLCPA